MEYRHDRKEWEIDADVIDGIIALANGDKATAKALFGRAYEDGEEWHRIEAALRD